MKSFYEKMGGTYRMDDAEIKEDFHRLYAQLNGMSLQDMGRILDPVCTLCRNHERCGFVAGIRIGMRLFQEMNS